MFRVSLKGGSRLGFPLYVLSLSIGICLSRIGLTYATVDSVCGPKSLYALCQHLGVPSSLDELIHLSKHSAEKGCTMLDLYRTAEHKSIKLRGVKISFAQFRELRRCAVALLDNDHFVAVVGFTDTGLKVVDPPDTMAVVIPEGELDARWSGYALLAEQGVEKPSSDRNADNPSQPDLWMPSLLFDFGKVSMGTPVKAVFHIWNVGEAPLTIDQIESSCSCLTEGLYRNVLAPSESTHVEIWARTNGRWGPYRETIRLHTNDPDEPVVALTVRGFIDGGVTAIPDRLLFEKCDPGAQIERKIGVLSRNGRPVRVLSVRTSRVDVLKGDDSIWSSDVDFLDIHLKFRVPETYEHELLDTLEIVCQDTIVCVPMHFTFALPIEIRPDKFFFGAASPGDTVARSVEMFSSDRFSIVEVDPPPFIQLTIERTSEHSFRLYARLTGSQLPGIQRGSVRLRTDLSEQPEVNIPVFAYVQTTCPETRQMHSRRPQWFQRCHGSIMVLHSQKKNLIVEIAKALSPEDPHDANLKAFSEGLTLPISIWTKLFSYAYHEIHEKDQSTSNP